MQLVRRRIINPKCAREMFVISNRACTAIVMELRCYTLMVREKCSKFRINYLSPNGNETHHIEFQTKQMNVRTLSYRFISQICAKMWSVRFAPVVVQLEPIKKIPRKAFVCVLRKSSNLESNLDRLMRWLETFLSTKGLPVHIGVSLQSLTVVSLVATFISYSKFPIQSDRDKWNIFEGGILVWMDKWWTFRLNNL